MKVHLIWNRDLDNTIGVQNELAYYIQDDLQWFKKITVGHVVVMGYNTWSSLPKRPLHKRLNIVISEKHYDELSTGYSEQIRPDYVYRSYNEFYDSFIVNKEHEHIEKKLMDHELSENEYCYLNTPFEIFIIGGARLYTDAYQKGVDSIYETKCESRLMEDCKGVVKADICIDTTIYKRLYYKPCRGVAMMYQQDKERSKVEIDYSFSIYRKESLINKDETSYLELLNKVYVEGVERQTRNDVVKSCFGEKMTFDLRNGFPLLTSKKMGWRTILRELLWFLRGSTNNKELQEKNVHIWDGNSSKEYMKQRGLDYQEGDLGPIYGYQWRNFGDQYKGSDCKERNGFDQLKYMIDLIQNDPTSRRIILSAWNPPDLDKMALPPCHIMFQIYVSGDFIDGQLYQRSGDMFLGVPFNIASYSFLLHIIGKITHKKPRFLYHILGDCHIYSGHYEAVEKQLLRSTFQFPKLLISDELKDIDILDESFFKIVDYQSHQSIKASMVV